jgi:hypothetical protein
VIAQNTGTILFEIKVSSNAYLLLHIAYKSVVDCGMVSFGWIKFPSAQKSDGISMVSL